MRGHQKSKLTHYGEEDNLLLVLELPELEVLRLTRGSRASYHNIFVGVLALILAALTVLPVVVVEGARIYAPMLWVGVPLASYGLFVLLKGLWQLHRTLNPKTLKTTTMKTQPAFTPSITSALPSAPANTSVTEGTTELLYTIRL